ncbi:hypothetical protein [Mesorhizobium intechi]|nr:hypothetical protein [Mesorhizobium intechi]
MKSWLVDEAGDSERSSWWSTPAQKHSPLCAAGDVWNWALR